MIGDPLSVELDLHGIVADAAQGKRVGGAVDIAGIGPGNVLVMDETPLPSALPGRACAPDGGVRSIGIGAVSAGVEAGHRPRSDAHGVPAGGLTNAAGIPVLGEAGLGAQDLQRALLNERGAVVGVGAGEREGPVADLDQAGAAAQSAPVGRVLTVAAHGERNGLRRGSRQGEVARAPQAAQGRTGDPRGETQRAARHDDRAVLQRQGIGHGQHPAGDRRVAGVGVQVGKGQAPRADLGQAAAAAHHARVGRVDAVVAHREAGCRR